MATLSDAAVGVGALEGKSCAARCKSSLVDPVIGGSALGGALGGSALATLSDAVVGVGALNGKRCSARCKSSLADPVCGGGALNSTEWV